VAELRSEEEIREAVRESYADAARAAGAGERASCGPSGCGCRSNTLRAEAGGGFGSSLYSDREREELPDDAQLASLGCGNPTAVAELHEGEVVLDLGSGGGIDVLLSARRVGPTGKAYGLDMTDEMLELARANQRRAGVENVEWLRGTIEDVPLPDASVDVVISNCVINLAADKRRVLREAARVLRPGGRFAVTDVIADPDMDEATCTDMQQWTGCIAGALTQEEFEQGLLGAGFDEIEIRETHRVHEHAGSAIVRARKPAPESDVSEDQLPAGCDLDVEGSRRQRDRYRELGRHASAIRRRPASLSIGFQPGVDPALLEETIAVERECCPFFSFDYEPEGRLLTIGVSRDDQRPALDALAYALQGDKSSAEK
jgi:arsenite methyltransferase